LKPAVFIAVAAVAGLAGCGGSASAGTAHDAFVGYRAAVQSKNSERICKQLGGKASTSLLRAAKRGEADCKSGLSYERELRWSNLIDTQQWAALCSDAFYLRWEMKLNARTTLLPQSSCASSVRMNAIEYGKETFAQALASDQIWGVLDTQVAREKVSGSVATVFLSRALRAPVLGHPPRLVPFVKRVILTKQDGRWQVSAVGY